MQKHYIRSEKVNSLNHRTVTSKVHLKAMKQRVLASDVTCCVSSSGVLYSVRLLQGAGCVSALSSARLCYKFSGPRITSQGLQAAILIVCLSVNVHAG